MLLDGGEGGIRTHAPLKRRPLFESGTMNHSDTSPSGNSIGKHAYRKDGVLVQMAGCQPLARPLPDHSHPAFHNQFGLFGHPAYLTLSNIFS